MKILYAPGMGKDLNILSEFRRTLQKFCEVEIFAAPYDSGELNPVAMKQVVENDCDWWIGLSLGASLLYYSAAFCPKKFLPQRLTVINPFSCRKKLAAERNFSLDGQWIFSPEKVEVDVEILDAAISLNDISIPIYHGIKLLNLAKSATKNLVFVDANHQITDRRAQIELAEVLTHLDSEDFDFDSYNSCNVYQRQRKISSRAD